MGREEGQSGQLAVPKLSCRFYCALVTFTADVPCLRAGVSGLHPSPTSMTRLPPTATMLDRFQGPGGVPKLIEALRLQPILAGISEAAEELTRTASLRSFDQGDALISQGDADNCIYLLLAGAVSVQVNGVEVRRREAGTCVGEMAVIDPAAPRAATVVALQPTVAVVVEGTDFWNLADRFPRLWKAGAQIVAARLRERGGLVPQRRTTPELFVGCSTEGLAIARQIQRGFSHDPLTVRLWTDGVFAPSRSPLDSLEVQIANSDFALLVLTADDTVTSRRKRALAPRDNVLFELGMFCGVLGRNRTWVVKQRGMDVKLPSDLLGFTPLEFAAGELATMSSRLGPVVSELRERISDLGAR
jgi:CRP/FNR family cyclic AMP-dependent transcriptional regulator